jgi:hypothetical protein
MIGDIQPLVRAVFNSPVNSVEMQPFLRIQAFRLSACDQADALRTASSNFSEQTGRLGRQGEADLFGAHRFGSNRAPFKAALIPFLRAGLGWRWGLRGENPPRGRG